MSDYDTPPPCPPKVQQTWTRRINKGWRGPWPRYRDVLVGVGNYGPFISRTTGRNEFTRRTNRVEFQDKDVDNISSCGRGICSTAGKEIDSITPAVIRFRQEKMRKQMLRDEAMVNELLSKKMACSLAFSHVLPPPKGLEPSKRIN